MRDQGAPARAHVQQAPGGGSGGTCQDLTPCSRQLSQRCFRRKKLKSSGLQKDLVAHAHVRSFHTSRTALDVIPCFSASTELSVSLHSGGTPRVSTNAPARRVRRQHWQLRCVFLLLELLDPIPLLVTPLGEEDLDRPRGVERRVTAAAGRRQRRCAPSRAGLNAHRRQKTVLRGSKRAKK